MNGDKPMRFSKWEKWKERHNIPHLKEPGVYVIAISNKNISGKKFKLIKEIIYFGMTNSNGGLKNRLQSFDNGIKGGNGHGGAQRFYRKFKSKPPFPKLFVSISPRKREAKSNIPTVWRIEGEILKQECDCIANYAEKYRELPMFNDHKKSPKK